MAARPGRFLLIIINMLKNARGGRHICPGYCHFARIRDNMHELKSGRFRRPGVFSAGMSMVGRFIPRFLFVAFTVVFAVYVYRVSSNDNVELHSLLAVIGGSLLAGGVLVLWEWRYQREFSRQLVATLFGLVGGLAATLAVSLILLLFLVPYNVLQVEEVTSLEQALYKALWQLQYWLPLIISSCLYIGVTVVLQTRDDFRFLIPYVDFSQYGTQAGGVLLDSSALIDGRILPLCHTGLFAKNLVIPDYVLRELQILADSDDAGKRERGRRGLQNAHKLQNSPGNRVSVRASRPGVAAAEAVDERLLADAKELSARVLTTDYNLLQVSKVAGVTVVNINDIYRATRPQFAVGDILEITLVKKGQDAGQAVGYLEDGTMVVVDQAASAIGQGRRRIAVTGNIQTNAGRMVFARLAV